MKKSKLAKSFVRDLSDQDLEDYSYMIQEELKRRATEKDREKLYQLIADADPARISRLIGSGEWDQEELE